MYKQIYLQSISNSVLSKKYTPSLPNVVLSKYVCNFYDFSKESTVGHPCHDFDENHKCLTELLVDLYAKFHSHRKINV